jgi:hypothetical protein
MQQYFIQNLYRYLYRIQNEKVEVAAVEEKIENSGKQTEFRRLAVSKIVILDC